MLFKNKYLLLRYLNLFKPILCFILALYFLWWKVSKWHIYYWKRGILAKIVPIQSFLDLFLITVGKDEFICSNFTSLLHIFTKKFCHWHVTMVDKNILGQSFFHNYFIYICSNCKGCYIHCQSWQRTDILYNLRNFVNIGLPLRKNIVVLKCLIYRKYIILYESNKISAIHLKKYFIAL